MVGGILCLLKKKIPVPDFHWESMVFKENSPFTEPRDSDKYIPHSDLHQVCNRILCNGKFATGLRIPPCHLLQEEKPLHTHTHRDYVASFSFRRQRVFSTRGKHADIILKLLINSICISSCSCYQLISWGIIVYILKIFKEGSSTWKKITLWLGKHFKNLLPTTLLWLRLYRKIHGIIWTS